MMTDEPRYTLQQLALSQRAAWVAAKMDQPFRDNLMELQWRRDAEREAKSRYPLPPRSRPRVVRDDGGKYGATEWKCVDGRLYWRVAAHRPNQWNDVEADNGAGGMFIRPERVKLLADLLANPTETVPDDE